MSEKENKTHVFLDNPISNNYFIGMWKSRRYKNDDQLTI